MRERHVERLRDSEYDGSRQEWESLLEFILVGPAESTLSNELRESIDVQCQTTGKGNKSRLTISLQISVEDIKSKRGSLQLEYSDRTEDVSFYEWTCQLVDQRDTLQIEVKRQQTDLSGEEGRIQALERQFGELLATKKDQETQMLSKFTRLLNEKKVRIRVLQRQVAEQGAPSKSGTSTDRTSARKRKYAKSEGDPKSDPESEGFEDMDVDDETEDEQAQESDQGQRTESGTESEPEVAQLQFEQHSESHRPKSSTPPPRSLPFSSRADVKTESTSDKISVPAKAALPLAHDSNTDSDGDDEL